MRSKRTEVAEKIERLIGQLSDWRGGHKFKRTGEDKMFIVLEVAHERFGKLCRKLECLERIERRLDHLEREFQKLKNVVECPTRRRWEDGD